MERDDRARVATRSGWKGVVQRSLHHAHPPRLHHHARISIKSSELLMHSHAHATLVQRTARACVRWLSHRRTQATLHIRTHVNPFLAELVGNRVEYRYKCENYLSCAFVCSCIVFFCSVCAPSARECAAATYLVLVSFVMGLCVLFNVCCNIFACVSCASVQCDHAASTLNMCRNNIFL